jgi:hypothetical protein
MPVIPATWEMETGESQSEVGLGKSGRPYLKNKVKAKDWGCGSSGRELTCEVWGSIPRTKRGKDKHLKDAFQRRIFSFPFLLFENIFIT